ncbi:unnamed protein product [Nippostrongylus brasiliensis]|uniref:Uncharacterized protein n=1 Tax=Nippostrongylus brasiliensis TaxID=27835 RepID=A0A0N4YFI0_NIPBR|nr:unnamed protein product [Nippostrongylus brasiliensis]
MTAQRTQLHVELFGLHLIFTLLVLVAYASGAPCKHANGSLLHDGDGYVSGFIEQHPSWRREEGIFYK